MSQQVILSLTIFVPLIGSVLIGFTHYSPNLREAVTMITATILFVLVASLFLGMQHGDQPTILLATPLPQIPLALHVEPLGILFAFVASFLWIVTSIYSIGYMRGHHESHQTRFYICFAIALASTMGVAFAGNMFTLFVFYELLTISTYPLVTHAETEDAKRAGRLYLGILLSTSLGLQLIAIIWTWSLAGTLDFTPGGILEANASSTVMSVLFVLYILGIGKAALMPFHRWLPAAMVAPTPVSALLHAVAVVKAGVFTILKVSVYIFGLNALTQVWTRPWLLYLAGATIVLASLIAMTKDNLKARLAYSTVSQLSYVVMGALLANAWGVLGSGMHIAMHAFGKITLFFGAGAIMVATHKTEISQLDGIGRTMPVTMLAFLIGCLSVIGLPPMGGMWSKWYLALGTLEAEQIPLLGVLMLSALLNVAYLLPIPVRAFFNESQDVKSVQGYQEAPLPCVIALVITSLGCLALFFGSENLYLLLKAALPAN